MVTPPPPPPPPYQTPPLQSFGNFSPLLSFVRSFFHCIVAASNIQVKNQFCCRNFVFIYVSIYVSALCSPIWNTCVLYGQVTCLKKYNSLCKHRNSYLV